MSVIKQIEDVNIKRNLGFRTHIQKYGMLLILLALVVLMSILEPNFLSSGNILNIIRQMSIVGIVAIGVTFIIITSGIDLASGSVIALTSVIVASIAATDGVFNLMAAIVVALAVGTTTGFISGTLIAKGSLAPFIATLGMMTAARGTALLYSGGRPIGGLSDSFVWIGQGVVFGIPVPVIIFLIVGIISWVLLNKTKFGSYVYAIGGNEQAAYIAGVNVARTKILVYSYAGFLTGIAGLILTARIASGQPTAGNMYELDAIASAVIGGTSLTGGIGTIGGTVIGALIIGVMNNGLDLLNVSSYWQQILKGLIIVVAVLIDVRKHKKDK